jgi:hypothetical protein
MERWVWILKESHAHFHKIDKISQNDEEMAISNIDKDMQIIILDNSKKSLREGMKINP